LYYWNAKQKQHLACHSNKVNVQSNVQLEQTITQYNGKIFLSLPNISDTTALTDEIKIKKIRTIKLTKTELTSKSKLSSSLAAGTRLWDFAMTTPDDNFFDLSPGPALLWKRSIIVYTKKRRKTKVLLLKMKHNFKCNNSQAPSYAGVYNISRKCFLVWFSFVALNPLQQLSKQAYFAVDWRGN